MLSTSEVLASAVRALAPGSVAVLGCAGGNGFEGLVSSVQRLVGVDLNPAFVAAAPATVYRFFAKTPKAERRATYARWWGAAKAEARHYWAGLKLLGADVRIAGRLVRTAASGRALTRRERRQLTRTVADVFRLVPVAVFLVVPFMEFLLPVALKVSGGRGRGVWGGMHAHARPPFSARSLAPDHAPLTLSRPPSLPNPSPPLLISSSPTCCPPPLRPSSSGRRP